MLKKVLLATAAAGLLSACASPETWDVDKAAALPVQGGAFNQALHAEYVALAKEERDEYDWDDTAYFVAKARAAAAGETVLPTEIGERQLAETYAAAAPSLRDALMARLPEGRTGKPQAAARAQGGFDCWIQEAEEGHQPDHIAACRSTYDAAMAELAAKPAPAPQPVATVPGPFTIFFATASSKLDAAARDTLKQAADAYRANKPVTVVIAGHTDTVGTDNPNILLSQKRAETVANALAGLGVDAAAMALEAYGEEQPKVATGDGVAEPRNRRVEITFKNDAR